VNHFEDIVTFLRALPVFPKKLIDAQTELISARQPMQLDVAFHPAQISLKCIGASASGGFHKVFELFGMVHCQPVR